MSQGTVCAREFRGQGGWQRARRRRGYVNACLCAAALGGLAEAARGENVLLPGTWYDNDKHHLASEPGSGGSWTAGYFQDISGDGYHDPGEPSDEVSHPGWVQLPDLSCWMATAANMLQYVGGPSRYESWAYTNGITAMDASVRTWDNPGTAHIALDPEYYPATWMPDYGGYPWPEDPTAWAEAQLMQGIPVGLSINWGGSMGHEITLFGIDRAAHTVTVADSDSDSGLNGNWPTYAYTWSDSTWTLTGYGGSPEVICVTSFKTNGWKGAGTGGNTSYSGVTTDWTNAANWTEGHVPGSKELPKLAFTNPGMVKLSTSASAMKGVFDGPQTYLEIAPTGSLSLRTMQNSQASITVGGSMSVAGDAVNDGEILISSTSSGLSADWMCLGYRRAGFITQQASTASFGTLILGNTSGVSGTYQLNAGVLDVRNGTIHVGEGGTGLLRIYGGTVIADSLERGTGGTIAFTASNATLRVNIMPGLGSAYLAGSVELGHSGGPHYGAHTVAAGQTLTIGQMLSVGYEVVGVITQTGGSVQATTLYLGDGAGVTGTYNMSGSSSTLSATDQYVGRFGSGVFIQNGGSNTISGTLGLAWCPNSQGAYTLTSGSLQAGQVKVGYDQSAHASFVQQGGTHTVSGTLLLGGYHSSSLGVYELKGGTLQVGGTELIGDRGIGQFTQSGGTHTLTSNSNVYLGNNTGSSGAYTITAGTFSTPGGTIRVGGAGTGVFHLNGGTVVADTLYRDTVRGTCDFSGNGTLRVNTLTGLGSTPSFGGTLQLGHSGGTGTSTSSVGSGGALSVGGSLAIGYSGTGTLYQGGGTVSIGANMLVGQLAGSHGTYEISGGTLSTPGGTIYIGQSGTGVLRLTGGMVVADRIVRNSTTGTLDFSGPATLKVNHLEGLGTDVLFGGTMQLGHSGGTAAGSLSLPFLQRLRLAGNLVVGYDAPGAFTQGGTVAAAQVWIGSEPGGSGSYTLNTLRAELTCQYQVIGSSGSGEFTHSVGSNVVDYVLILGNGADSQGSYRLSDGELSAITEVIGWNGHGQFEQIGGTNTATTLCTAYGSGTGTYELAGGQLSVMDIVNEGAFLHIAGTLAVNGTFTNTGAATFDGVQQWGSGAWFKANAGASTFNSDAGAGGANLNLDAKAAVGINCTQHLKMLTVGDEGVVTMGTGGGNALVTEALSVTGTGILNLADEAMVVKGGDAAAIRQKIAEARNPDRLGKPRWDGSGIGSSAALAVLIQQGTEVTTLGMAGNAELAPWGLAYGTFAGEPVGVADVLVRYTYAGDANLDGRVTGNDYALLDTGFALRTKAGFVATWLMGDFNYDGMISASDYALIDTAYGLQATVPLVAVPEPGVAGALALGALAGFGGRRRGRERLRR